MFICWHWTGQPVPSVQCSVFSVQCPVFSVQCGENYGPGQESCRVQPSQELRVHSNILEHIVRGSVILCSLLGSKDANHSFSTGRRKRENEGPMRVVVYNPESLGYTLVHQISKL